MVLNRGYQTPLQRVRSTNIFRHTRPENFKDVLSIVLSSVNFVRSQTLNHSLFRVFCNEAQHNVLLYYTKVPWLSCVRVLIRVRELRKEIEQFLRQGGSGIAEHLENEFIMSLALTTFQIYSATSTT